MGMSPVEVSEKLNDQEMQTLVEETIGKYDQTFEVLSIGTLVGGKKKVLVRLQNGLKQTVIV